MSVNITEVRLLSVPLENDYKHTIYFRSRNEQETYFKDKTFYVATDYSYQRKDNYIRVGKHIDELLGKCNYVMYKNSAYSNKYFYAFITKMEYVNDNNTYVYIETDVMQTWMFDITIYPSFVEREHVENDTIGLHTQPEQLETGEYVCNSNSHTNSMKEGLIILGSTVILSKYENGKFSNVTGGIYNGVFSGVRYYAFTNNYAGLVMLVGIMQLLANSGQSDAITTMFMVPRHHIDLDETEYFTPFTDSPEYAVTPVKVSMNSKILSWNASGSGDSPIYKPTTLDGYTPRNNKLFTYPYCYLLMSNNAGGSAIYHYELFYGSKEECEFDIHTCITPGCSTRVIPKNYSNLAINYEEGLTGAKYPICSWNTDVYTNWLTQNSVNIKVQTARYGLQAIGSILGMGTGNFAGGLGGLTNANLGIASTMGQIYAHSLQPPHAEGNLNSGDVAFASGNLKFSAYGMSIKSEYARIIDKYFDMYGYKVNMVKIPNYSHMTHYWYTKTIGANIDGDIPTNDLQKIKAIYDNGVTFWQNGVVVGDYSVVNRRTIEVSSEV